MSPEVTLMVRTRTYGAEDRLGNRTSTYADAFAVPGCLFAPGTPQDLAASRPDAAKASATAHFPRGWSGHLRGALVSPDGKAWYRVIGEPCAYPDAAVGGRWTTYVLLERTDG